MTGEREAIAVGRRPQPGGRPPAPGRLAVVQAFLNSHYDLEDEHGAELLHSPAALVAWLRRAGLLAAADRGRRPRPAARARVRDGLRTLALDGAGRACACSTWPPAGRQVEVRVAPGGELQFVAAAVCRRRRRARRAAGDRDRRRRRRELVAAEDLPGRPTAAGRSTTARATARGGGARCRSAADGRRRAATTTAGAQRRRELRRLAAPGWAGPLSLVAARARRRPGRWLWPVLGLTLAVAFACAVAGEATIAGDRAARAHPCAARSAPARRHPHPARTRLAGRRSSRSIAAGGAGPARADANGAAQPRPPERPGRAPGGDRAAWRVDGAVGRPLPAAGLSGAARRRLGSTARAASPGRAGCHRRRRAPALRRPPGIPAHRPRPAAAALRRRRRRVRASGAEQRVSHRLVGVGAPADGSAQLGAGGLRATAHPRAGRAGAHAGAQPERPHRRAAERPRPGRRSAPAGCLPPVAARWRCWRCS